MIAPALRSYEPVLSKTKLVLVLDASWEIDYVYENGMLKYLLERLLQLAAGTTSPAIEVVAYATKQRIYETLTSANLDHFLKALDCEAARNKKGGSFMGFIDQMMHGTELVPGLGNEHCPYEALEHMCSASNNSANGIKTLVFFLTSGSLFAHDQFKSLVANKLWSLPAFFCFGNFPSTKDNESMDSQLSAAYQAIPNRPKHPVQNATILKLGEIFKVDRYIYKRPKQILNVAEFDDKALYEGILQPYSAWFNS